MTAVDNTQLLERRHKVLGSGTPLFYDRPIQIVRGEGVWVYDEAGRRYLDAYNNVPHVGHCHPRVVDALCAQARVLNLHTRYLHENVVRYAERLTSTFDDELDVAMFCCTGTEANELALRMARHASGGTGIIVSDFSYHGNSAALAQATTGLPTPDGLAAHVRAIPIPDPYRDESGASPENLADIYAGKVEEAIQSLKREGVKVAALLLDTVFSTEGLPAVPNGFLKKAVDHVRDAGGYFIADEVQPGFGRMGERMWGYSAHGVVPDFVTLGKPMGNGHPMGGVVTRRELNEAFYKDALYFNTFAGNPVSASVGLAVLDVVEDEDLIGNARRTGSFVLNELEKLAARHDIIGDVRGKGLFFGLELVLERKSKVPAAAETRQLINMMRDEGVLISRIGSRDNVLKMRPPMVFTQENAEHLVSTLNSALSRL